MKFQQTINFNVKKKDLGDNIPYVTQHIVLRKLKTLGSHHVFITDVEEFDDEYEIKTDVHYSAI